MNEDILKKKRDYLRLYRLFQTKIKRLLEMSEEAPDRAEYYLEQIVECQKSRNDIENRIERLEDKRLSEILFQKYVCAKTFEQIAYEMNFSSRHIQRLHNKALCAL